MKYLLVFLAVSLLGLAGCRPGFPHGAPRVTRTYEKPVPPLPPAGMVRIVPRKVREDGETVHWTWTLVGDRNWTGFKSWSVGQTAGLELVGSFLLDATDRGPASNAYECELVITAADAPEAKTVLRDSFSLKSIGVRLAGAIEGTVASGSPGGSVSGDLARDLKRVTADQAVNVLLTDEQTLPLPLDVPLLELKAERSGGEVFQQTFRIKVTE
jgi:hypothetical protein